MRKTKPTKTEVQSSKFTEKVNVFFRKNIFLLAVAMVALNFLTYCSNSSFHDEALSKIDKHGVLLKENLGKVHFLTASGQHIVGDRYELGFADPRFKQYLKNVVLDNLLLGMAELTKGFSVKFKNPQDVYSKNSRIKYFEDNFVTKKAIFMKNYRTALYRAVVEGRYPEYMSVSNAVIDNYVYTKAVNSESKKPEIRGTIRASLYIKSWIKELKVWDTREIEVRIPFKAIIDVERYATVGNPFGVSFTTVEIPAIIKPTADDVKRLQMQKGRGRR